MDGEIKCVVKIPEGFEPSREDVERLKRDVWDSMIERLGEMLLAGEPKRALLPEVVSTERKASMSANGKTSRQTERLFVQERFAAKAVEE